MLLILGKRHFNRKNRNGKLFRTKIDSLIELRFDRFGYQLPGLRLIQNLNWCDFLKVLQFNWNCILSINWRLIPPAIFTPVTKNRVGFLGAISLLKIGLVENSIARQPLTVKISHSGYASRTFLQKCISVSSVGDIQFFPSCIKVFRSKMESQLLHYRKTTNFRTFIGKINPLSPILQT